MKVFWILLLGCIDLVLSVFFIILIVKYSHSKISRFLCDGIFFLYVSIVLNLASYMVMTIQDKFNLLLCLVLLSLLFICIFLVLLMTYHNLKSNKYCETKKQKQFIFTPFYSGVVGIIVAKLLLKEQSQQEILSFMASLLLILSFITGIPSIILLKAWLYKRYIDK